jgi:hypothetical protein
MTNLTAVPRCISFLLIVVTCFSIAGCHSLEKKEFIDWVRDYDNALHVKQEHSGYVFDLQFKPWQLSWIEQGNPTTDQSIAEEEFSVLQYYTLTIRGTGGEDIMMKEARNEADVQRNRYYYSYLFQQDISLVEGDTVLPCVLYHFEKSTGLVAENTFLLGFENPVKSDNATLVIKSDRLNSMPIRITISKDNIPSLNL